MSEAESPKKESISSSTRWYLVFTIVFVLAILGASRMKPASQIPRETLPMANPSQKLSISSATKYLTDLYGEESVKRWKAEYLRRPMLKTDGNKIADPEPYPKIEIEYLLQNSPKDYVVLHDNYLITSVSVVRFTDSKNFPEEAIDVYINQAYKVKGIKYHAPDNKIAQDMLPHLVNSSGLLALAKFAEADTTKFDLVSQNRDPNGFWHLRLQDKSQNLASGVTCGYNVVLNGANPSFIMPYVEIPAEALALLNKEASVWRIVQRIAYVILMLFIVSGIGVLFKNKIRSVESLVIAGLFVVQMLFDVFGVIDIKLSQIWGDVGWWQNILGFIPALSLFLLVFANHKISMPGVKHKHPEWLKYYSMTGLLLVLLAGSFIDTRNISVLRYIYDAKVYVMFVIMLRSQLLLPILALGVTVWYRHLATMLSDNRFGSSLSLAIAFLVAASFVIIINPAVYSTSLAIYSIVSFVVMAFSLFLLRYDFGSEIDFSYSVLMVIMIHLNNPLRLISSNLGTITWITQIAIIWGMIWLCDLVVKRSPKL